MRKLTLDGVAVKFPIYESRSTRSRSFFAEVFGVGRTLQEFWALKDISFCLDSGDRLAIVGGNGAGKSTLLKVIAGILPPTRGSVVSEGVVNSAILASDGLYFEATCLQNIYLKAASQGLSKAKIEEYAECVVESAKLGRFINSPLKALSTGMRARLIVAMQIGLRPNILVMDEWIGTADQQVVQSGILDDLVKNTDLFVLASHRTEIIKSHCNKGLFLEHGEIKYFGDLEIALEKLKTAQSTVAEH